MRRRAVAWSLLFLAGSFGSVGLVNAQPASPSAPPIRVRSAKRAAQYSESTGTKLTPRNPEDVVLVVQLGGISIIDFQATAKDEVFLTAGDRRFEPSIRVSGDWKKIDATGKPIGIEEDRAIVVMVPRDILKFSLRFGKRPALNVDVDRSILPTLP